MLHHDDQNCLLSMCNFITNMQDLIVVSKSLLLVLLILSVCVQ